MQHIKIPPESLEHYKAVVTKLINKDKVSIKDKVVTIGEISGDVLVILAKILVISKVKNDEFSTRMSEGFNEVETALKEILQETKPQILIEIASASLAICGICFYKDEAARLEAEFNAVVK
jgi:hypothetical protein